MNAPRPPSPAVANRASASTSVGDVVTQPENLRCRWCGADIVAGGGAWLHVWTMDMFCPERMAEPDPAGMAS